MSQFKNILTSSKKINWEKNLEEKENSFLQAVLNDVVVVENQITKCSSGNKNFKWDFNYVKIYGK